MDGVGTKKLRGVSRQPLTNFVNLKSNTIMKKPQHKDMPFFDIVNSWKAIKYTKRINSI